MKVLMKVINALKERSTREKQDKIQYMWYHGISFKLMLAFSLPVLFVILIGYISYHQASDAIISKYKASSLQAIEMTDEYINFGMESIMKTSLQYTIDPDIIKFVDNKFENGSERLTLSTKISGRINQEKQWGEFLSDIHILSDGITVSTSGNIEKGLFSLLSVAPEVSEEVAEEAVNVDGSVATSEVADEIEDGSNEAAVETDITKERNETGTPGEITGEVTEEGAEEVTGELTQEGVTDEGATETPEAVGTIYASLFEDYWSSKELSLDEKLSLDSNTYAVRFIKGLPGRRGAVVMDISTSALREVLQRLDFGKKSKISFVTTDGTEITRSKEETQTEATFVGSEFYRESISSEKESGTIDAKYLDKDYLYLYTKIGDTGNMICVLIPESTIVSQVSGIKQITYLLVIVASILAILIGTLISTNMQSIIKYMIHELKKVAAGNLRIHFNTKRKDEFSILTNGLNDTVIHMRGLITNVQEQSDTVKESSSQVRKASEVFAVATKDIIASIHEIQQGIDQQAQDSQDCLHMMDHLSEKIEDVSGKTSEINQIAQKTKNSIQLGLTSVEILNDKTNSTAEITDSIVTKIQLMEQMSSSIGTITATINSIADSTNLLSLNASIEAARAGAAGSGFKVVADEIRKLADQSLSSVKKIDQLISSMQQQTSEAVATAKAAEQIIKEQEIAFQNTKGSFQDMNQHAESLINNVSMILVSIQTIEKARQAAMSAIESISAVSQQTAAASISVNETTMHQTEAVNALDTLSKELEANAELLHQVIDKFEL